MRQIVFRLCAVAMLVVCLAPRLTAQQGSVVTGSLVNSLSGDPVSGATVLLEELRRQVISGADGTFTFDKVPAGAYHVSVRSDGYSSRRTELMVPVTAGLMIAVDPELHFEEVTSVSVGARSQFETFQATSVLSGQELAKQLNMSLGATLEGQPGVASRSFGPGPARPVIRGLDGDRVLILTDGQRVGDLSSQSADHGVVVNPAAAQRIEVVRGPATLLYGANAIGGLVNVITDTIPTKPLRGSTGTFTLDLGSAARESGGAADVHVGNGRFALHLGGGGRNSGDVRTPEGPMLNSQTRSGFGNIGLAWTSPKHYAGASYGYDDTRYGAPIVEDGQVELTPRKHSISFRAGGEGLSGLFSSYRATVALRRYKHEEIVGGEIGTAFSNNTNEIEIMGAHRPLGRLSGSMGAWVLTRAFDARGDEALSPAVDQRTVAAFLYEEATWPHVTLQAGGRVDRARYDVTGESGRTFTTGSGSAGALFRPAAANDRIVLAVSVARAARYPALEELFYFGFHPGNFAFEIGNPALEPEHALGADLSFRWKAPRVSGEVTYFRNSISNYLFRSALTPAQFAARQEVFAERFATRGESIEERSEEILEDAEGTPLVEYIAKDSVLQGVEAHADIAVTARLSAEVGLDYVRGTAKDGESLPRIPPLRGRLGLRYQRNAFQAGGDLSLVGGQDRLAAIETPTARYQLLKLYSSYSFQTGQTVSTLTFRVDNLTNELYRSHLSLIKDLTPEMGRNIKLLYTVKF